MVFLSSLGKPQVQKREKFSSFDRFVRFQCFHKLQDSTEVAIFNLTEAAENSAWQKQPNNEKVAIFGRRHTLSKKGLIFGIIRRKNWV